ncbi:hypothetical protein Sme01_67050 [Sphaerisporangium melleum]|uniref:Uncharacterized protein n=1 Tax=Sphaerisporangium melleum TaxID=321316 RepID=A0A917VPU0_9ACTN|nr:hypothetical protein [Sphaerisporangium melleum]GGL06731.1 hypothetical protein GCM10007964_56280 [Sphaerisporangium melleum]GII74229.1 hypothetical protein Sme01_67050 [Sphaerisporangium melleum]
MRVVEVGDGRIEGVLTYVEHEYGFSFEPGSPADLARAVGGEGVTSVTIGTLQIEVGVSSRRALYVWGYHPRSLWEEVSLSPPAAKPGAVILDPDEPFEMGVSEALAAVGEWPTAYDPACGWLRIAPDGADDERTEVATGVVLGRRGRELHSVWLQPFFEA